MTMGMRVAGLTWCTLAALAVPALAHAQSVTQAPAAETVGERAAPFFQEGLKAADEARWADAEASYLKAWAMAKTFDIAANLGVVELKLGKPRLAATHLAFSLRTAPPSAKAPHLERTRQLIEEAKKQVGVLRVRVNVAQARVLIDGEPLLPEETPDEIFVEPGTHRATAQRDGYIDGEKVVTVEAGTSQEVTLSLVQRPAASQAEPAKLATVPVVPPARRGEEHGRGPRTEVLIGGAATAGAAAIAGVVFTVLAVTKGNDAEEVRDTLVRESGPEACSRASAPPACANLRDTDDAHIRWANGAILSFTAAGVIGAGTAIYWLVTRPSEAHEHVRAVPIVGAHGVGLSVSGGF